MKVTFNKDYRMFKKTALCIALSSLFVGINAQAATIYEESNGDNLKVYGEVGVGGHIGADNEYGEFYTDDKSYIDDSFATLGIKGQYDVVYYRLELDFERENWSGADGDMVVAIDKMFIGYRFAKDHAIEFGLTDTALDDYDKFGDFTFDTTVETGEAGDQASTIKYEGSIANFRAGASFSYEGESSSGDKLGDVYNGYVGYFGDVVNVVVGAETRTGSKGESKYGEQFLFAMGARFYVTDSIAIGVNGYLEKEDKAQVSTLIDDNEIMMMMMISISTTITKRLLIKVDWFLHVINLIKKYTSLPLLTTKSMKHGISIVPTALHLMMNILGAMRVPGRPLV